MDQIREDIAVIKEKIVRQEVHMERYNALLEEHIKRTNLLESRVIPIEDHVKFLNTLAKVTVALMGGLGSLIAILKAFG